MTDSTIAAGKDAWVLSTSPNTAHPEPKRPRLTSGVAEILVALPLKQQVRDRNVFEAVFSGVARNAQAAQTITVAAVSEAWSPRNATWNDQPAVGSSVAVAVPALAVGDRFEVDVTALVQAVAAGGDDYGFLVSTNAATSNRFYGFATGLPSWQIDVEFADAPEPPVPLSPIGGSVGIEPVVAWDYSVGGGDEDSEQVASRVWVNTSPTQTGAVDSGWVANELPEFDLSLLAGWVPVDGTTYYWQVQVNDGGVDDSEVSDWAEFTYRAYPAFTLTNPGTGVVWDSTPTIAFEVATGTIKQYRIQVFGEASGVKRYDSGWTTRNAATVTRTLPEKWQGKRVHVDDRTYRLVIRVRDRLDRVATGADPGMIVSDTTYVFDDDATATPPDALHVAQIGNSGRVRLTGTRPSGVSLALIVKRNGRRVARVDWDDDALEVSGTTFSWVDDGAAPYVQNVWTVQVIDDGTGKQTTPSPEAFLTTSVEGVWLLGEDSEVMLDGVDVGGFTNSDSRAVYSPIGLQHDVDIVYSLRGLTGGFTGGISSSRGRDWEADLATLRAMRSDTDETVRLVYGTVNVPVILRNVSPGLPSPDLLPHNMKHYVTFEAHQVDEFGDD